MGSQNDKGYNLKTAVRSAAPFFSTVIFALYNGWLGISRLSVWHGSICVFYMLLSLLRMIMITAERRSKITDKRKLFHYRRWIAAVTAVTVVLNLSLIMPIAMLVRFEKPVYIGLVSAIAMAAYTVYKITMASLRLKQQRKKGGVFKIQMNTVALIDALVSVLVLQNTLVTVNETGTVSQSMLVLSAYTGAAIYIVIVIISIVTAIKSFRTVKKY